MCLRAASGLTTLASFPMECVVLDSFVVVLRQGLAMEPLLTPDLQFPCLSTHHHASLPYLFQPLSPSLGFGRVFSLFAFVGVGLALSLLALTGPHFVQPRRPHSHGPPLASAPPSAEITSTRHQA